MIPEELAVCVLAHIAAMMYHSNKVQLDLPIKKLSKYYIFCVLAIHGLFTAFIVGYDIATGTYEQELQLNGYCKATIIDAGDVSLDVCRMRLLSRIEMC